MSFKIPKKRRQEAEPEMDNMVMQSPLSRLQDSTSVATNGWGVANGARGRPNGENGVNAGKRLTFRDATQRPAGKLPLRSVVRNLLGLDKLMPAANQRQNMTAHGTPSSNRVADGHGQSSQPAGTSRTQQPASNGWRPRRASDRLLPSGTEKVRQQRKDSVVLVESSEQDSMDTPARTSDRPRNTGGQSQGSSRVPFRWSSSSPEDSPPSSPPAVLSTSLVTSSPPGVLSTSLVPKKTNNHGRLSLGARRALRDTTRASVFTRLGRRSANPEPIVLSSEEEDNEDMACTSVKTPDAPEGSRRVRDVAAETCSETSRTVETPSEASRMVDTSSETSRAGEPTPESSRTVGESSSEASRIVLDDVPPPPSSTEASSSSTLELQFSRMLLGQLSALADGTMLITESCIFLPLKGLHTDGEAEAECLSVAVVSSQLRGYGVWEEEGVAVCGHALLFLWVTDSHAKLLQTELSVLQPVTAADGACPFILLELAPPPTALQLALLRSILDVCGTCPVSVSMSHALSLMHKHPSMLALLGQDATRVSSRLRSKATTCLTTRLIQYPLSQGKGRIAVTTEDLSCLNEGEFLNDVIIDFYLKYLLLECSGNLSERCHVFSSFFYRQLTKRRTTEEEPQPLDKVSRHQRVKTWTRNVDIFDKDFLFIPVNQESHWWLVMVCFPGLVKDQIEETRSSMPNEDQEEVKRPRLNRDMRPRGPHPVRNRGPHPECTMLGWKKETALKRPCILVMDSLERSKCRHENVCRLIREYMHVEWTERRKSSRLFTSSTMQSSVCTLPLQDNSSDCGLYLLQYVETFLKNPVVHFELPVSLNNWFPRQQVRRKREEIRQLVMEMHRSQTAEQPL